MANHIAVISAGLFAYFGPYMIQVSALFLGTFHKEGKEVSLIKPRVNFLTMESISMLPPQCDSILLVAWGEPGYLEREWNEVVWTELRESDYHGMKLVSN
eukprot:15352122-Ditylum_brightwellii.AAC.1